MWRDVAVVVVASQLVSCCSEKGTTVAWRGNNLLPHTHGMDVISRHYIESEGLKFVDTRGIMEYFKADIATGMSRQYPGSLSRSNGAWLGAVYPQHTPCNAN